MPQKFSEIDKSKWLELYNSGKTEKWIAREHARCDLRTIRKGLEEARRKQDARVARAELLRDALRKHQDSLLKELDDILSTMFVPSEDFVVLSWWRNAQYSIFPKPEPMTAQEQPSKAKVARAARSQEISVRGLLKQHLKNERLWKVLAQREAAYAAHSAARVALQLKTVAMLEEKTGYKLVDKSDAPKPFLYSSTAGDSCFKAVLYHAFGHGNSDLETDIVTNTDTGDVRYRNLTLAEAPGNEERVKASFLDAVRQLKVSPEAKLVVDTFGALEEATTRARRVVEQIKLLGLIPGQCDICRRLGM